MSITYSGKAPSSQSNPGSNRSCANEEPTGGIGSPPNLPSAEPDIIHRRGDRRKHYRIVFKGKACHALWDLSSDQDVFTGLHGGLKRAGYIHRDISAGNVLLVKETEEKNHGILIDLEYATRFPAISKEGRDDQTRTLQFMAAKVKARAFLFLPIPDRDPLSALLGTAP